MIQQTDSNRKAVQDLFNKMSKIILTMMKKRTRIWGWIVSPQFAETLTQLHKKQITQTRANYFKKSCKKEINIIASRHECLNRAKTISQGYHVDKKIHYFKNQLLLVELLEKIKKIPPIEFLQSWTVSRKRYMHAELLRTVPRIEPIKDLNDQQGNFNMKMLPISNDTEGTNRKRKDKKKKRKDKKKLEFGFYDWTSPVVTPAYFNYQKMIGLIILQLRCQCFIKHLFLFSPKSRGYVVHHIHQITTGYFLFIIRELR